MISAPFSDSLIAPQLSHVPDLLKFAKQIHSSQLHKHTTEMSFLRIGLSVTLGASLMHFSTPPLLCETKRRFYDDENAVNPVPGTVTKSAGTELEAMGPSKLVDGASVRTSSTLESAIKSTRLFAAQSAENISSYVDEAYAKYHSAEKSITSTASKLHDRSEDLLPNSIYIVVATLSGNIAARQRGILAKMTFPVVFGLAAFRYFLPQTFSNTAFFAWKLEQENLPQIAKQQLAAVDSAVGMVNSVERKTKDGQTYIGNSVESLKKSIADVTGVDIDADARK